MKSIIHKSQSRGLADHGWLKSRHTFSFADYYDPERVRFGLLRVLNDDIVQPGMGFGTHPHDNMEIISIPLKGELAHQDSMGKKEVIKVNDIQIMSAGSGLLHSEFNNSNEDIVNFLQIWIFPKVKNIKPRYDQLTFEPAMLKNKLLTVISPEKNNGTLWINQDAYLSLGNLDKGTRVLYDIQHKGNGVYVFIIDGAVDAEGIFLEERDAAGIEEAESITIAAGQDSKVLLIEVPIR